MHINDKVVTPPPPTCSSPCTDAAMLNAMSQLQGLVDALPELPDEVQGALAVKVPGLLETPAAEVGQQLESRRGDDNSQQQCAFHTAQTCFMHEIQADHIAQMWAEAPWLTADVQWTPQTVVTTASCLSLCSCRCSVFD